MTYNNRFHRKTPEKPPKDQNHREIEKVGFPLPTRPAWARSSLEHNEGASSSETVVGYGRRVL